MAKQLLKQLFTEAGQRWGQEVPKELQGALQQVKKSVDFDDLGREDARLIRESRQNFPRQIERPDADTSQAAMKEMMDRQKVVMEEAQRQLKQMSGERVSKPSADVTPEIQQVVSDAISENYSAVKELTEDINLRGRESFKDFNIERVDVFGDSPSRTADSPIRKTLQSGKAGAALVALIGGGMAGIGLVGKKMREDREDEVMGKGFYSERDRNPPPVFGDRNRYYRLRGTDNEIPYPGEGSSEPKARLEFRNGTAVTTNKPPSFTPTLRSNSSPSRSQVQPQPQPQTQSQVQPQEPVSAPVMEEEMPSAPSVEPVMEQQPVRDYGSKEENLKVWARANRKMIEDYGTKEQREILASLDD